MPGLLRNIVCELLFGLHMRHRVFDFFKILLLLVLFCIAYTYVSVHEYMHMSANV